MQNNDFLFYELQETPDFFPVGTVMKKEIAGSTFQQTSTATSKWIQIKPSCVEEPWFSSNFQPALQLYLLYMRVKTPLF